MMKITRDLEYRAHMLDRMRGQLGLGQRREGVHVSDLINCTLKSWAERQLGYTLEADDRTVLTFMRGLSHEQITAEGFTQVRAAYCLQCQRKREDIAVRAHGHLCPTCGETLLTGTIDWMSVSDDLTEYVPVEMKSTLKSARKNPDTGDMMWFVDQLKSYMYIHALPKGKLAIFYVMGDYSRKDRDIRDGGPPAELLCYELEWDSDEERIAWGQTLQRRKRLVEGESEPPLDDVDSPTHPFICEYCIVGARLPSGLPCERYPWNENGTRKGSKAERYADFDQMTTDLLALQEKMNATGGNREE